MEIVVWRLPEARGTGNGALLFNASRVSVLQDKKNHGGVLHSNVDTFNTIELYTLNG